MKEEVEACGEEGRMNPKRPFGITTEEDPLCNCIQMLLAKDYEENGASPL